MAIDVFNALPRIGERKPTELPVAAILAIIFVLRDWGDCDLHKTTKNLGRGGHRDGGSHRVKRENYSEGIKADRDGANRCLEPAVGHAVCSVEFVADDRMAVIRRS